MKANTWYKFYQPAKFFLSGDSCLYDSDCGTFIKDKLFDLFRQVHMVDRGVPIDTVSRT